MYSNEEEKLWLDEIISEHTTSIRSQIIAAVKHHSAIWEIPLRESYKKLYDAYTRETGHPLVKTKLAKIDQVALMGKLDVLLRLAKTMADR